MNLEILLCLCFVCEIVMSLGYWARPGANTSDWDKKTNLASRRHNGMTEGTLRSDRHRDVDRLIPMDKPHMPDGPRQRATIKMRGRETMPIKNKRAREDDDQKKPSSDVLSSGVLDPYSLRRQLQHILDETKTSMNASLEVIGHTAEYNEILLIKMSSNCKSKKGRLREGDGDDDDYNRRKNIKYEENVAKKLIFIVHNLNPIGADGLGYLKNIRGFMTMLEIYVEELKRFDIFLIPVANPDGFTVDQAFWYKNVSPQDGGFGVNLDHNFDVAWKGTIENTCSQFYQGPSPFSEPETKAIRDIFFRYNHNMIAYLNIHASSYGPQIYKGDAVLYPKGYSETTSNDDKYMDLRGDIDEALRNASLHLYSMTVDTMFSWYGKVTGKSVDYASSIYGVPFALEICMQAYEDANKGFPNLILNEVWSRIFKVIFNNIEKSLRKDDHMRRYNDITYK